MDKNNYDEICSVLFEQGRHDLIQNLQETSGADMANEIQRLKKLIEGLVKCWQEGWFCRGDANEVKFNQLMAEAEQLG